MNKNILNLITPVSTITQNNHTVKKTILESLSNEYILFKKFEFVKELLQNAKMSEDEMPEEEFRKFFNKNILEISKNNSKEIFSSRLINNSFENERFHRTPRKSEDIKYLQDFHEAYTNKNLEPPTIYLAEAARRESATFSTIENSMENIFKKIREKGTLTKEDIEDTFIFSKIQISRHKHSILYSVNSTITEYNIDINALNVDYINKIRENVFRHQLTLKNQHNLFTHKYAHIIDSEAKFWLGDCDTLYNKTTYSKRYCYCLKCTNENTSNCLWEDVPINEVDSCTMFLTPHFIIFFDKNETIEDNLQNLIKDNWNQESLKNAFFHIIVPKDEIDELFKISLELIKNKVFFKIPFNSIENLYKVEKYLKGISIPPEEALSTETISTLDRTIKQVESNKQKFIEFDVPLNFMKKIDIFFRQRNIKIYDDLHKHPEHKGIYISKRIKLFNSNNEYIYYLSKGK